MKAHFDQCFKSFSTKMLNCLGSCEKEIKLLTDKVESVERAVEELNTGSTKHTEEEVKDNVQPTQQQVTGSKKHEGSNSEKEDSLMKDNINVGASESVNASGDAKGKKAAMKEEEAPEPSFCEIDPKTCDVDFDAVALAKNAKARAAAQIVTIATSARNRQLAATQKSPFLGNSTTKAIIPTSASHSGHVRGYDPFDQTGVRAKHTTLMNFVKANPAYPRRPKNSSIDWYYILRTPKKCLSDTHMEAYINVLRLRLSKHPEWFVSDRICFLNSMFATIWRRDYNDVKNSEPNEDGSGKLLPPGAYSYYTGELSIYCQTKKTWAYEVDHLYSMLHIKGAHWTCAPDEDKWRFPYTPFTHSRVPGTEIPQNIQSGDCGVYCLKYIECHALDFPFPPQLCDKNIRQIREKMAAEIFDEIGARGHDKLDANGLDVYDRKA
ncbi:uncharacterized protein LOC18022518 [Eutrema salsugineum]|uniref:uncharacterized protein LOC18022518 n=1 Tax=Eutrema salsugineum TaxID=72664 RepID=UPI000CED7143|nr:uncharacterized protein LOC18022518 [Eutrema salsugineum]